MGRDSCYSLRLARSRQGSRALGERGGSHELAAPLSCAAEWSRSPVPGRSPAILRNVARQGGRRRVAGAAAPDGVRLPLEALYGPQKLSCGLWRGNCGAMCWLGRDQRTAKVGGDVTLGASMKPRSQRSFFIAIGERPALSARHHIRRVPLPSRCRAKPRKRGSFASHNDDSSSANSVRRMVSRAGRARLYHLACTPCRANLCGFDGNHRQRHDGISRRSDRRMPSGIPSACWYAVAFCQLE